MSCCDCHPRRSGFNANSTWEPPGFKPSLLSEAAGGSWILRSSPGCTHSTRRADSTASERGKLWTWCLAKGCLPAKLQAATLGEDGRREEPQALTEFIFQLRIGPD